LNRAVQAILRGDPPPTDAEVQAEEQRRIYEDPPSSGFNVLDFNNIKKWVRGRLGGS